MKLIPELRSRWEVARKSLGEKKQVVTRLVVITSSLEGRSFKIMPRFQLLAPAKNVCGGGVLLAIFAWVTWAITFGTFAALSDHWNSCGLECYEISLCWESNITNTTTLCYGAGVTCITNCYMYDDPLYNETSEAICRELNNCDAILVEEQLSLNECSAAACVGVPTYYQSQMAALGLLILLLSGTVCLNCYKEAATKPECTPCKEVGGIICLYGSVIGAFILIIYTIITIVTFPPSSEWTDSAVLTIMFIFLYILGTNTILVVCACMGRCLLAKEGGETYDSDCPPVGREADAEQ